jgi:PHD/YefM family antitoxin component YafN of YafNO toxin-antitoxin module
MNVQYITDESGKQKAVIIPIEEWNKFKTDYEKMSSLQNKQYVLNGIKDAFKEVEEIKQGKRKKGKTLSEFLNEV